MSEPFTSFPSHHCLSLGPRGIQICVSLLLYCNCRVPADACCFLQVPGKEFTRTCKGLVVVLIGGYVLLQLLPSSLNYLAIIPSKTIPYVWTVFTAGYIEQVLPGAIGSSLGLLFCGKDIEPVWGRKEFLKFIILVNSICGVLAFCFAIGLYYVTGKESFL
jgi:membrane associated rhomboid family serine protease